MSSAVRVVGVEDLMRKLKDLGGTKQDYISILTDAAWPIRDSMKRKAPVDTSDLQGQIDIQDKSEGDRFAVGIGVFDRDFSSYATYQEYGTGKYATGPGGSRAKRIPWLWVVQSQKWADIFGIKVGDPVLWYGNHPHPFIRPAFDEEKNNALKLVSEGVADFVRRKAVS